MRHRSPRKARRRSSNRGLLRLPASLAICSAAQKQNLQPLRRRRRKRSRLRRVAPTSLLNPSSHPRHIRCLRRSGQHRPDLRHGRARLRRKRPRRPRLRRLLLRFGRRPPRPNHRALNHSVQRNLKFAPPIRHRPPATMVCSPAHNRSFRRALSAVSVNILAASRAFEAWTATSMFSVHLPPAGTSPMSAGQAMSLGA